MQKYYSILGLAENATLEEVKKAYRKLAIRFHPDRNKNAGAEEQFRSIAEAYQKIIDHKAGRYFVEAFVFEEQHVDVARQAAEEARRKQEEEFRAYMQTDDFKFWDNFELLGQLTMICIFCCFIIGFVVGLSWFEGLWGFVLSSIPVAIAIYFVAQVVVPTFRSLADYKNAILFFLNGIYLLVFALIVFNTVVFFKVGMNTFIPSAVFIGIALAGILFLVYWAKTNSLLVVKHCLIAFAPILFLNGLLFLNYVFATTPKVYFYKWEPHIEAGRATTTVDLENNAFQTQWHTRTLTSSLTVDDILPVNAEAINKAPSAFRLSYFNVNDQVVEMHIAQGFFGIPVLKGSTFMTVVNE